LRDEQPPPIKLLRVPHQPVAQDGVATGAGAMPSSSAAAATGFVDSSIVLSASLPSVSGYLARAIRPAWQDSGHLDLSQVQLVKPSPEDCHRFAALPAVQVRSSAGSGGRVPEVVITAGQSDQEGLSTHITNMIIMMLTTVEQAIETSSIGPNLSIHTQHINYMRSCLMAGQIDECGALLLLRTTPATAVFLQLLCRHV
jgi:hypothetical protein